MKTPSNASQRGLACAALVLLGGSSMLVGCAGDYVARTAGARQAYESYNTDEALERLESVKDAPKDHLLYLLDKGMVLHAGGKYAKSIEVLKEADRLSANLDFTSVSEETVALLTSERERTYRGEDFEKLMISVLQALNYTELGKDEDALVEIRRVNERLHKMIVEEKKPYEQLAIARYLSGILYEDQGDLDNAFIDYEAAFKLQPQLGALVEPLLRLARQTDRADTVAELKTDYSGVDTSPIGPAEGQLVVIVEAGRSPEKESLRKKTAAAEVIDIPHFRDRGAVGPSLVTVGDRNASTVDVTSLSKVAKSHLDERVGRLLAKALVQTGLKAGLAAGVAKETKSEGLGLLTFLLLSQLNQADLRSWLSLPAEFQVARLRLPAGKHKAVVVAGGIRTEHAVEIHPRRIAVLVLRRY